MLTIGMLILLYFICYTFVSFNVKNIQEFTRHALPIFYLAVNIYFIQSAILKNKCSAQLNIASLVCRFPHLSLNFASFDELRRNTYRVKQDSDGTSKTRAMEMRCNNAMLYSDFNQLRLFFEMGFVGFFLSFVASLKINIALLFGVENW